LVQIGNEEREDKQEGGILLEARLSQMQKEGEGEEEEGGRLVLAFERR
jgi:hypothetical protein